MKKQHWRICLCWLVSSGLVRKARGHMRIFMCLTFILLHYPPSPDKGSIFGPVARFLSLNKKEPQKGSFCKVRGWLTGLPLH